MVIVKECGDGGESVYVVMECGINDGDEGEDEDERW